MQVNKISNNPSFEGLRIKIIGDEFKKRPDDMKKIKQAIKDNAGIKEFFSNHRGKITVMSESVKVPVVHDYPMCLRKVPSYTRVLPFDQFTVEKDVPRIKFDCHYSRAFALRNLFRKPVWLNAGTGVNADTTWESCMEHAFNIIRMLGKDTAEDMAMRGDTRPRDFASVEARRLKVEKP